MNEGMRIWVWSVGRSLGLPLSALFRGGRLGPVPLMVWSFVPIVARLITRRPEGLVPYGVTLAVLGFRHRPLGLVNE